MQETEALRFLAALIKQLGDQDFSFTLKDPSGGPPWDVYYVIHERRPYTLAIRVGLTKRVEVGLFVKGTLSEAEGRRALALQAPS